MSLIIAISGASASGKSLFARRFAEVLNQDLKDQSQAKASILGEDSYYRPQSHLTVEQRASLNFDHPDAIDSELLARHLAQLKQGQSIERPVYCYKTHDRIGSIPQLPCEVVIVEGLHLLGRKNFDALIDLKIFIETPLDICLLRRALRDTSERGRTVESVFEQYTRHVRPMFIEHIEPTKVEADLVISGHQPVDAMWQALSSSPFYQKLFIGK